MTDDALYRAMVEDGIVLDPAADPDDIVAVSGDEVFDLIAEAAKTSPHAERAYQLLRDANPAIMPLEARQRLTGNRTKDIA